MTYFDLNDTNLKITEINGNSGTYSSLNQHGIITLTSSQTLYACIQINYTSTVNGLIANPPGNVYYYRIA